MTARYLVQIRSHGEPWRTVDSLPEPSWAANVADNLSAERHHHPISGRVLGHVHAYVRVTYRGEMVYDPRSPKAVSA